MSSKRTIPLRPSEQRSSVSPRRSSQNVEIDLDRVGRAERLKDDVVVLEGFRLFFRQLAGLDELVDERLIAGQLNQTAVAQHVGARVADLSEKEVVVHERGRGHRRAHPASRAIELGLLKDAEAGRLDAVDEAPRQLVARQRLRVVERFGHSLVENVDGELAGDLAGRGTAHPVAHGEERTVFAHHPGAVGLEQTACPSREVGDEEVVLVVFADLPDVGSGK